MNVTPDVTRRAILISARGPGVAAVAAATGCQIGRAPAPPPTLKTGITLQWASTGAAADRVALLQSQAELFTRKYPGVKVEVIPDGESLDKINAGIAAGSPMDLLALNEMRFAGFASRGALAPLDPLIKRDRYDLSDFFPRAVGAGQWRGTQWGMSNAGTMVTYLNLALTEQSGARRPPDNWRDRTWDWNAFLEYGRKTTRRDGDRTTHWGFAGPYWNIRTITGWIWSNGGDLFDRDFKQVMLGEPAGLEGLQFQADLMNRHRIMPHPKDLERRNDFFKTFEQGRAGMALASPGFIGSNRQIAGLRWTVTALPRGAKDATIVGGAGGWFIAAGSPHRDETWELLKTIMSPESIRLAALSGGGGAIPQRRSVANDPAWRSPKEAPGADMKVVMDAVENAVRYLPILIQGEDIYVQIMERELDPVWSGERSVRDAVTAIKARIEPLLARERA